MNYIVSLITVFDNDNQLWETLIGIDSPEMPLLYSCWGETEWESRKAAETLVFILENQHMIEGL